MSFDRMTRNTLARAVGQARERLKADATDQLRRLGFQDNGTVLELDRIAGLTDADRVAGRELRALLDHISASEGGAETGRRRAAFDRLAREIGFTTLNRLVALRLAEERGLIIQSVGEGMGSVGFQLFDRVANGALGDRSETFRAFLESLWDEVAVDLPLLFDRTDPRSRIFPSERCLGDVLESLLNNPDLAGIWGEDETIGWVYQYYNDPDERRQMRESQAPLSSRELAVRNQFFTPRYVVEFLTDNTLGRTWYEMRHGETRLAEDCRYLVRRRHPIWLSPGEEASEPFPADATVDYLLDDLRFNFEIESRLWTRPNPDIVEWRALEAYALTAGYPPMVKRFGDVSALGDFALVKGEEYRTTGQWSGSFEDLRACLFFFQRAARHTGSDPEGEDLQTLIALNRALCSRWDLETETIPYRSKKDPREIRVLDPACGSGHFLLYAFDLLLAIYNEAYDDPDLGPKLQRDYTDRGIYDQAVPVLILFHNLHGIDIDPRACQIAGVALWLRVQRRYRELGLKPVVRPQVRKTNVVCAEPMPGERKMLEEYLLTIDTRLRPLVRTVWEKMHLAGEAGALLKIEEEIASALAAARQDAMVEGPPPQFMLNDSARRPRQSALTLGSADNIAFWQQAETKLLVALQEYATRASDGGATQRRLFVEDAAQGFAFIDICYKRYDIVLMNPPYMAPPKHLEEALKAAYPDAWTNFFSCFIRRAMSSFSLGYVGTVSSDGLLSAYRLRNIRKDLFDPNRLELFSELGTDVFEDMALPTVALCIGQPRQAHPLLIEFTAVGVDDAHSVDLIRLRSIPNLVITLEAVRGQTAEWHEERLSLDPHLAVVAKGATTFDDNRFVRLFWEVASESVTNWRPFDKGGDYQPFWAPTKYLLNWRDEGREIRTHGRQAAGTDAQVMQSSKLWGRLGLVAPEVAGPRFGPKVMLPGTIFSAGTIAVVPHQPDSLNYLVSFLNSIVAREFLAQQGAGLHIGTSRVRHLPIGPLLRTETQVRLNQLGTEGIDLWRTLDTTNETSRFFTRPERDLESFVAFGKDLMERIDVATQSAFSLSSIDDSVQRGRNLAESAITQAAGGVLPGDDAERFLSYAVGCVFGRWDIRVAIRAESPGNSNDLIAPVSFPPGQLLGPDNYPAKQDWLNGGTSETGVDDLDHGLGIQQDSALHETRYPVPISWDGLLEDDEESPEDIVSAVRDALSLVWASSTTSVDAELCSKLKISSLRSYFSQPSGFFNNHLSRYSLGRRQAPLYWPLSTASRSYTLWLYYHRLTEDTLDTAVNRYVLPKMGRVQREKDEAIGRLDGVGGREATRLRDDIERGRRLLAELEDLRDELLRVAALPYRPNLDDGVIINAAPLHKLFRHRNWARDTRAVWDKLERGDYDWAHLAYQIWPERVREKCRTDRSLAIAHGLEELYEAPAAEQKGQRGRRVKVSRA